MPPDRDSTDAGSPPVDVGRGEAQSHEHGAGVRVGQAVPKPATPARMTAMLIAYQAALVAGVDPPPVTDTLESIDEESAEQLRRARPACDSWSRLRWRQSRTSKAQAQIQTSPIDEQPPPDEVAFPTDNGPAEARSGAAAESPAGDASSAPAQRPHSTIRIGRFEIIRELGSGGHGVVVLAHDPLLRRDVALKLPRPESMLTPDLRRRFAPGASGGAAQPPQRRARLRSGRIRPDLFHRFGLLRWTNAGRLAGGTGQVDSAAASRRVGR